MVQALTIKALKDHKNLICSSFAVNSHQKLLFRSSLKAKELDHIFDTGEDIIEHLDLSTARRMNLEQKRLHVDIPVWMIKSLDEQAK